MFDCSGLMKNRAVALAYATQLGLAHNSFSVLSLHNPVPFPIYFIRKSDFSI